MIVGVVPVNRDFEVAAVFNPPAPCGKHTLNTAVIPVLRSLFLAIDKAMLANTNTHVADERHGSNCRAFKDST